MTIWEEIPDDAIEWFRSVFETANKKVSERLINVPNIREPTLDDGFIESITSYSAPRLLPSGAVVGMQIHNIGGLRRIRRWETADIAILIFVYRNGKLSSQKIGLLQSKRLYPENNDVDDNDPVGFSYGLNAFLRFDPSSPLARLHRVYSFHKECIYGALKAGDAQVGVIDDFNAQFGDSIYYMLYNPPQVPTQVQYPVENYHSVVHNPLGCRIYTSSDVNATLAKIETGKAPTLADLEVTATSSNWRLESWVADLLLRCKVGQVFGDDKRNLVTRLIERRSGPIGAAIAISIALPAKG